MTLRVNGGTLSGPSIPNLTTAGQCAYDAVNTGSVTAGQYINWQVVSGATTAATIQGATAAVTPTGGAAGAIMIWGVVNATVTTTQLVGFPLEIITTSTVNAGAGTPMPGACTASNLYVMQAVANSGVTTTFTLYKNGAATSITGTVTSSTVAVGGTTGTGVMAIGSGSVSFAQGDTIGLGMKTASGTSGTVGHWSVQCQ